MSLALARISSGPLLALSLVLSGCGAPPPLRLAEGPRSYGPEDYEGVLARWTRGSNLTSWKEMDSVLWASATYESWDFRTAYSRRYAHDFALSTSEAEATERRAQEDTRAAFEFYVALMAQRPRDSDLLAEQPAWVLRLVNEQGEELAPETVLPIRKVTVLERSYYPYTSAWRSAFRVRFPRVTPEGSSFVKPGARYFLLRFSGPQGRTDLRWNFEPSSSK